jgi:site-specific DNA recombinase
MSPDEQRDACETYSTGHACNVTEYVDETDSVSGGSMEREGLQYALSEVRAGRADGIIVAKVDRFSRTLQGGLRVIGDMERDGQWLISVREGVMVGDERASATDKLVRNLFLMLAQWQRDTLAEGWDETRARANALGIARVAPYGYVRGEDRRLYPDPETCEWVPAAFALRADGLGVRAIATELQSRGAVGYRGAVFTAELANKVLQNRVYLGELWDGEYVNVSSHEPLVDRALFDRAQAVRGPSKVGERETALLAGIARCSGCGQKMLARHTRQRHADGSVKRRYTCRGHFSWGDCPRPASIDERSLDAYVLRTFRDDFIDVEAEGVFTSDAIDAATSAREAAEAEVRRYVTDPAVSALASSEPELWSEGLATRNATLARARDEEDALRNAARGFALPEDIGVTWDELGKPEARAYLVDAYPAVVVRAPLPTEPRAVLFNVDRVRIVGRDEANAPELVSGRCAPIPVTTRAAA